VVLEPSPRALEVLARLRIKGFGLAIDDFGAGFSNIEQLRQFPYSKLKVDRAYVTGAAQDRFALAALKASVMLARELNMKTVAEGVETATDWRIVAANKVDEAQGYWLSHPLAADEFVAWYREHRGRVPQAHWRDVCSPTLGQSPVQHQPAPSQPAPSQPALGSRLVSGD
jgi:EAL domain-containing protein (putative c-di-GMP-specific phosphodiesterase class I)